MKCVYFFILIFLSSFVSSHSNDLYIIPEQPKWGEEFVLYYNLASDESIFMSYEEVHSGISVFDYYSNKQVNVKGILKDTLIEFKYRIPDGTTGLYIGFYSMNSPTGAFSAITIPVINRNNSYPKGGRLFKMRMYRDSVKQYFEDELESYPDSYLAYKWKWGNGGKVWKGKMDSLYNADLEIIKKKDQDNVEVMFLLAEVYSKLQMEAEARQSCENLLNKYPEHQLTHQALHSYSYLAMVKKIFREPGPHSLQRKRIEMMKKHPEAPIAYEIFVATIGNYRDSISKFFTYEELKKIYKGCIKIQPDNCQHHYAFARGLYRLGKGYDEAIEALKISIALILTQKTRYQYDFDGERYMKNELPDAYLLLSKIYLKQKKYSKALSNILTAQKYTSRHMKQATMVEAKIWHALGMYEEAEKLYIKAKKLNAKEAEDSLKSLYRIYSGGSIEGFEDYLKDLLEPKHSTINSIQNAAKDFEVTSISGGKFSLSELKGKVVVLNFWFVGCAPCRMEIPYLNKMVRKYKDKDVVFIAFAKDKQPELEKFLKRYKFKYNIIPNAKEIAGAYKVRSYPTHVIIDKKGNEIKKIRGGVSESNNQLEYFIEECLK